MHTEQLSSKLLEPEQRDVQAARDVLQAAVVRARPVEECPGSASQFLRQGASLSGAGAVRAGHELLPAAPGDGPIGDYRPGNEPAADDALALRAAHLRRVLDVVPLGPHRVLPGL